MLNRRIRSPTKELLRYLPGPQHHHHCVEVFSARLAFARLGFVYIFKYKRFTQRSFL